MVAGAGWIALICAGLWCWHAPAVASENRVALVVGISAYEHAPKLTNTGNDAQGVGAALKALGFDVDIVLDPDRQRLEQAVRHLGGRSRGADVSLFYYAGHALEFGGQDWLIPRTADLHSERDLRFEALDVDAVLEQTNGGSRITLIFLDACRDNPFRLRLAAGTRGMPQAGLGQVGAGVGTLVAFSAAPGTVAADGSGRNSPFTAALLKHIATPGLEIRQMLSDVRRDVRSVTNGRQVPWENSALEGQFFFSPTAIAASQTPSAQTQTSAPRLIDPDLLFWDSVRNSSDIHDFKSYLAHFPDGIFGDLARNRIAQLAPAATLHDTLVARLTQVVPELTSQDVVHHVLAYERDGQHKAQAALGPHTTWRVHDWESAATAEEKGLEGCQAYVGHPCALVAVDDDVRSAPPDGTWPVRDMPRVRYAGVFNPEQIPAAPESVSKRPDVAGYVTAPGPKAAAYHPWGRLFVVTAATDQIAAEAQALAACNTDPDRKGNDGPCLLYAIGNEVVLPLRRTKPTQ